MYRQCGELLAVIAGCLLTLRYLAYTALVCRSLGQNIDLFTAGTISNWTANHIGGLAVMNSRLDLIAGAVAICVSLLALVITNYHTATISKYKQWLAASLNAHVSVCLLFSAVIALFHIHWNNWSTTQYFFTHGLRAVSLQIHL